MPHLRERYMSARYKEQEHAETLPMVTDFARKTIDTDREENRNNLYRTIVMN